MHPVITDSLSYIEANLLTDITASELAERAGYTVFHFYRIFREEVGQSVMHYILHRRLLHAIYEIGQGSKRIDAVLRYGFDTYACFYRAFIREFGCSPSAFLEAYPIRRPHLIEPQKEEKIMDIKQITKLLRHWGIEGETVTNVYDVGSGDHRGNVFYVGKHYVLKSTQDASLIIKERTLSQKLKDAGLSCAEHIKTIDGLDFVEDAGSYYYVMSRLAGKALCAERIISSHETARYVGEIIGQLHTVLSTMDVDAENADLLQTLSVWAVPKVKTILPKQEGFLNTFLDRFSEFYPKLTKQLIHRDPNPSNMICAEDAWGFLDFELSEKNVRIYDPCYATTAILSECLDKKRELWLDANHAILHGYDSVVHLTPLEREACAYVTLANQLICTAWFAENEKYAELFSINREMTSWLIDNFDSLKIK